MTVRTGFLVASALGFGVGCFDGGDVSSPTAPTGRSQMGGRTSAGGRPDASSGGGADSGVDEGGHRLGEACSEASPCRDGLTCDAEERCAFAGDVKAGEPCTLSGECGPGLRCYASALDGAPSCQPAGAGETGAPCGSDPSQPWLADAECARGFRCALVGLEPSCQPEGDGELGAACARAKDCFSGAVCVAGACAATPPGAAPFGVSSWQGETCSADTEGAVRAYFEVPGAEGADEGDFFRLPFPNDARRKDGKIDLSGFPTPGDDLLGFDPVGVYVDALQASGDGWGAYPTVTFRFSGGVGLDSLGAEGAIEWVDVTPGDPELGASRGLHWSASTARGRYLCRNWVSVRRPTGRPLLAGHTYAVWLTSEVKAADGSAIQQAPHLRAVLSDAPPDDAKLLAAHTAFASFRAYIKNEGIPADAVVNATAFTVGAVRQPMAELAAAVRKAGAPAMSNWAACGSDGSPCSEPCSSGSGHREYHGELELRVFQQGTAPYLTEGGSIDPQKPRKEKVCATLTVPAGTMPPDGWPTVVFAHGTGGSHVSHVRAEVSGALAAAATPSGDAVPFAVLGIDQVQHGARRGNSTESPDRLFFNFRNPAAARGNPLQGAADQIALALLASGFDWTPPGEARIALDPAHLAFFGHSQGAMHGSLALPYADEYQAAVLSGNGASILYALLTKTSPTNISAALPFALQDATSSGGLMHGEHHPVLALIQQWIDPADPLHFATALARDPAAGAVAKHVFQTYGLGDTYSPPLTLETFVRAAEMTQVAAHSSATSPDPLGSTQPAPLSANLQGRVTLGFRQYAAESGSDGHFVAFEAANADVIRFLAMAGRSEVPAIGE